jgi:hypothetical protein
MSKPVMNGTSKGTWPDGPASQMGVDLDNHTCRLSMFSDSFFCIHQWGALSSATTSEESFSISYNFFVKKQEENQIAVILSGFCLISRSPLHDYIASSSLLPCKFNHVSNALNFHYFQKIFNPVLSLFVFTRLTHIDWVDSALLNVDSNLLSPNIWSTQYSWSVPEKFFQHKSCSNYFCLRQIFSSAQLELNSR